MKKLIIVIIILVAIGGIIFYLSSRGKPAPLLETPAAPTKEGITPEKPMTQAPPIDPIVKLKNDLTIQARVFIERYGSWSNQFNFENFEDIMPYMTEKLKAETQNLVNQYRASKIQPPEYYGLTTNVISLNLKNFVPDEKAEFSASIQQQETKDGKVNIFYKTAELIFVKEGMEWKVNQIEIK